jgi:nucleoside-diphosphate-sugar epimerase
MRIALTGVSGFIGSAIARHLAGQGHSVTGLVRSTSRRDHVTSWTDRLVEGDQADATVWPRLLEDAECIIHNSVDWEPLRAPHDLRAHLDRNVTASIELLEASAPRQFIFISSIGALSDILPRWEGVIDEDHPLRPESLYGAYKAAVEAHLWQCHLAHGRHTSAVRPCAVYGIDPRLERSIGYPIVEKLRAGEPFRRRGGGKFVHVDDVAQAVVALVGNPEAAGRAYNLADCYARWSDLAVMAAELLGIEAEIDTSSPPRSRNVFSKEAVQSLGVALDRGHDGLRTHLRELIDVMSQVAT